MKALRSLYLLSLMLPVSSEAFTYNPEKLENDLRLADAVVIAVKVGGRISPLNFDGYRAEVSGFNQSLAENEEVWKRLEAYNSAHTPSTFMVLASLDGSLREGDVFYADDDWISVDLGSVFLYFLKIYDPKRKTYILNPCHRISARAIKKDWAVSKEGRDSIIRAIVREKLSLCSELDNR